MKIFAPKTTLEIWHMIKDKLPVDEILDLVRYGELSREMLEECATMESRQIATKARERLNLDKFSPVLHFRPAIEPTGEQVSDESVDFDPRLMARVFFPDSFVRTDGLEVEIEFGEPTITQSLTVILAKIDHRHKQQTSIEIREYSHSIDDARSGKDWTFDNLGGFYRSPRVKDFEIAIDGRKYEPAETAFEELRKNLSDKARMTISTALSMLATEGGASIQIDLLELAVGVHGSHCMDSIETAKAARAQVFNDIEFGSLPRIKSMRRGRYKMTTSSKTVGSIEVSSDDMLYRITKRIFSEEDRSDCLALILEPAGIMKEYAGQRHILSDFGSVKALLDVKQPNRPPGMLARSVGATLNQLFRENSSRVTEGHNGDNNRPVAKFDTFKRRQLLLSIQAYKCEFDVLEFLSTKHGKRLADYWNDAIKELQRLGVIGYYKELGELDFSGRDWRDNWLDQPLIIRPGAEGTVDALTIAKTKKKRDKAIQRSRRRSAKKAESINETGNPE